MGIPYSSFRGKLPSFDPTLGFILGRSNLLGRQRDSTMEESENCPLPLCLSVFLSLSLPTYFLFGSIAFDREKALTAEPPPEWPINVTWSLFPPKESMYC